MTDTSKYVTRMVLFLVVVSAGCAFIAPMLLQIFLVNPAINGVILAVLLIGAALNFRQVIMLGPEGRWIDRLRDAPQAGDMVATSDLRAEAVEEEPNLRLLSPMARMIGERRGRLMLSAPAMRTLLDGIASRMEEGRDLARYFTGLCIFLGLLGTFWGLLETVKSIADVIRNLSVTGDDMAVVFGNLKKGLEAPLTGMGTAFSSSLFGLAGSLVLGFLDLQAAQAQNHFFNELEEWLSGVTHLSTGATEGNGGGAGVSVYTEALLEQTAERIQDLATILTRSEQNRAGANQQFNELNSKLAILADQMRAEQQVLLRLAENQRELTPVIRSLGEHLAAAGNANSGSLDDGTRNHIRSIDNLLQRVATSLETNRDELVREIRGEIKLLARTLAGRGRDGEDLG